jgi:hypothetical protein
MYSGLRRISVSLFLGMAFVGLSCCASSAQQPDSAPAGTIAPGTPSASTPDSPTPQLELASSADAQAGETQSEQKPAATSAPASNGSGQSQNAQRPAASSDPASAAGADPAPSTPSPGANNNPAQSNSSPQTQQPGDQESLHQKAEEQLKQQETQRVAGIMATFNTTRNPDALPLSPGQKYRLFFRSAFDPWPFGLSAVVAGINQAANADAEWGQGVQGYAKRFGSSYSDYFIGNFFGNAVLPSLLREDPRYFQKGSGSAMSRFLWAAASTVWCKRDRGGWGPNYANVGGNLIGAAIARTYYPASERNVTDTITDGFTVSAEGIVGAEVIEFWPDMVRHHRRKEAEKEARAKQAAEEQKNKQKQEKQDQN